MLGRLARWLRLLGFDALYDPRWDDNELVRRARSEERILLTRDVSLVQRRGVRTLLITSERLEPQLRQVVHALGLPESETFARCPICNALLERVPKSWAWGYVPPYTFCTQTEFRLCPDCNRFYWRGSHHVRMQRALTELVKGGHDQEDEED